MTPRDGLPLLSLILLSACQTPDGRWPRNLQYCAAACERVAHCSYFFKGDRTCESNCAGSLQEIGPHLRRDFLAKIDDCAAETRCSELTVSTIPFDCAEQAARGLSASVAAEAMCRAISTSLASCEGLASITPCLVRVVLFDDSVLKAGRRCTEQSCAEAEQCLMDTLGVDIFAD